MSCQGKCQNCLLPAAVPGANLNTQSVCSLCSIENAQALAESAEVRRERYKADLEKTLQDCRGKAEYDVLVNLSGGKDSCLLLHKLKHDYGLNVLAFTTDINIPDVAWTNIRRTVDLLDVPHVTYRPPVEFYKKMFRFLLSHQESRGAVRTVCYVCAPLFEGYSLRFAIEKGIPLVAAGYAPGQPEPDRMEYEFSRELLCNHDWTPPELVQSGQFSDHELKLFWNPHDFPEGTEIPRYIAPFHAWDYSQEEAMDLVVELGLIKNKKSANPIHSNCPINWLLMYSDLKHLGFNPYAPEFSKLIREGKANRTYWRFAGPLVNAMIRQKVLLGRNVAKSLSWLNMKEDDLAITRESQGAEYAEQLTRNQEPQVMTWEDVTGKASESSKSRLPRAWKTTVELMLDRIRTNPDTPSFGYRSEIGEWASLTWSQFGQRCLALADELRSLGIKKGDRVAVHGATELGWTVAEVAIHLAGAIVVGLDVNGCDQSIASVIDLSRPRAVITVGSSPSLQLISDRKLQLITIDRCGISGSRKSVETELRFEDFELPIPSDDASIIFTSGTTGDPKGMSYTHKQFVDAVEEISQEFPLVGQDDATVCWLPMNHLFQRMMNLLSMRQGAQIYFEPEHTKLLETVQHVEPVVLVAVPRLLEKLADGIESSLDTLPSIASAVARRAIDAPSPRRNPMHRLAQTIIQRRAKRVLGGRLRYLVCGSAPLSVKTAQTLEFVGWEILEAYGVSENIVPVSVNRPSRRKVGTVGQPLPSNEVKIAADGEILVKGPGSIKHYWGQSESVLNDEGFFATGDLGFFDDDGCLVINGRKDSQIKTSTGRKLLPEPIEQTYKQSRYVSDITVHGQGRKCLVGLIVPSNDFIDAVEDLVPAGTSRSDALNSEAARLLMKDSLSEVESSLEHHERLADFRILPQPFRLDRSEITSSLKKRRGQIESSYVDELDAMYGSASSQQPVASA